MNPTLLEELIAQIKVNNPSASPEEISEGIASILSKEILPDVLKHISLPKFPSVREEIQEAKVMRGIQGSKADKVAVVSRRRSLIQHVEHVRTEMGWDGINDTSPKGYITDSPSVYPSLKTRSVSKNEETRKTVRLIEDELTKDTKEDVETINTTSQKLHIISGKNSITLSESTQRKIVSEPLFETFFEHTEVKLRNVITKREPETQVDVFCDSDEESPDRTKCIIRIHPPANLDFKGRMKLSTIFDIVIRNEIKDLKLNNEGKNLQYLQNLNRNIFVHVDL